MRRLALVIAVLLCSGSLAHAAALTVHADQAVYNLGDTVTLTVLGEPQGQTGVEAFARLNFSIVGSLIGGTPTPIVLPPWLPGPVLCDPAGCDIFNQTALFPPLPSSALMISSVSLIAVTPGVIDLTWETDPSTGKELRFFGLTNAPGTSITIVPEPATALLLCAGLAALAARRRRYTP